MSKKAVVFLTFNLMFFKSFAAWGKAADGLIFILFLAMILLVLAGLMFTFDNLRKNRKVLVRRLKITSRRFLNYIKKHLKWKNHTEWHKSMDTSSVLLP